MSVETIRSDRKNHPSRTFVLGIFSLVDHLHGALTLVVIAVEGREVLHVVLIIVIIVVVNGKTELDETVDTRGEGGRLIEGEAGGEEGGVVEEPDEVLDGLVTGIGIGLLAESGDDGVGGVDLHGLLGGHVGRLGGVAEGLGLHDTLHVGGPAELTGDEDAGGVGKTVGNDDLLDLVVEDLLHELAEALGGGLGLLELLLLVLLLLELESLLGGGDELLALELLELLDGVLVYGVDHVDDLVSLLLETLEEGAGLDGALGLAGDVVDAGLLVVHTADVVVEAGHLLAGLDGVVTQELGDLGAVGGVLVDAELEVLGKGLVELLVGVLVLGEVVEHLDALLDEVLLDDAEDLVLLESLTGDVEGKVLGIDDALDEGEPLGHDVLAVVHDENATDVKLDLVELLLGTALEHVEGSALGAEEDGAELELTLDGEVLDGGVLLPVVGEGLVEGGILVLGDVVGLAHPDGLHGVEVLPLVADFLDLLGLLLLLGVLLVDLLDLKLVVVALLVLVVVVGDLLLGGLLGVELDGEADELGVLLDEVLDALLLEVLGHVLLEVEDDAGTTADGGLGGGGDGEGSAGLGAPGVGLVVVALGGDLDLVGDEVGRVETNTELSDHGDVGSGGEGLHEGLGSGLGDGTEVVDEVGLGHADTGILNGEGVVGLVGDELDVEVGLGVQNGRVGEGLVTDLVEGIGGVGDQLTKEDLLVRVEGVDDEGEELVDISREGVAFSVGGLRMIEWADVAGKKNKKHECGEIL